MFAGIVEESAQITAIAKSAGLTRLTLQSGLDHTETGLGDSIAVDGVCLTVVEKKGKTLSFEISAETLRCSSLGELEVGDKVNLERSLLVGERIHGHFVFGHVDATVKLVSRTPDGDCDRYTFELPEKFKNLVVPKGSVSLSGISLTVGEVGNNTFSVYIIPHTSKVTTLGSRKLGSQVNFEVDMLARYMHSIVYGNRETESTLTPELLEKYGYKKSGNG